MPNLIDYLETVKELTFDQEPLNILDKVCINEIGYLTYEMCIRDSFWVFLSQWRHSNWVTVNECWLN